MDKICSRWRPLKGRMTKRRRTAIKNSAISREKRLALKMKSEQSLQIKQELNLKNFSDSVNITTSTKAESIGNETDRLMSNNEEFVNRSLIKEEVFIKDEILEDFSAVETTETNIVNDSLLAGSDPSSVDPLSLQIQQELLLNHNTDTTGNNNNVRIGVDDSLQNKLVKGTFSLETIGSKTLIVFRKLPDSNPIEVEKAHECPECSRTFNLQLKLKIHMGIAHNLLRKKKSSPHGKYIKMCPMCMIPTEPDSPIIFCTLCKTKYLYQCKNCKQTFPYYNELFRHINTECLQGYYQCPHCDFKSGYQFRMRKHMLVHERQLGTKLDLSSVKWKDFPRNANGLLLTDHVCSKCGVLFESIQSFNVHLRFCSKLRLVFESTSTDEGAGKNSNFQGTDTRKTILQYCEKCDISKNFDRFCVSTYKPFCTICQTKLKFKCTRCDGLNKRLDNAIRHLTLKCQSQTERYVCNYCEKTFRFKKSLREHVICEFRKHMQIAEKKRQLECTLKTSNVSSLDRQKEILQYCEKCDKSLILDSSCFLPRRMFRCTICQTKFKFKCSKCNLLQKKRYDAIKHSKLNCQSKREPYVCNYCKKKFDLKEKLKEHVQSELKAHKKNFKQQTKHACLGQARKENSNFNTILRRKCDATYARNSDLTRQLKNCDEKLQMQCKVLLTKIK